MDGKKFDDVARRLASSRRTVLKGLAGALAAALDASTRHSADAQTRQPNGAACTRATQCASLRCSDGVCCDSACMGQCESCASGTCQLVVGPPVGSHPTCPGSGPCAATCDGVTRTHCAGWPGSEVVCGAVTCTDGVAIAHACSGNGQCVPTTTSCGPYVCGPAGCLTGCTSDAECAGAAFCAGGICQGDQPLGAPCAGPDQCQSGICADGVCCQTACDEACRSCDQSGSAGFCTEEADGEPCAGGACCDGACVDTQSDLEHCGACDQACRLAPAAGSCEREPICVAGQCGFTARPVETVCRPAADDCDIADSCDGSSTTCPADAYQPSTFPCRGASCADGVATLAANCPGDSVICPAVQTQVCSPHVCGETACRIPCSDDNHCILDFHCDEGLCVCAGLMPAVATVPSGSHGTVPAGWKVTCLVDPNSTVSSPTCPVVELCLHTFWVHSRSDNATRFLIVAYDEGGNIAGQRMLAGVRYIWKIEVDEQNQTVTFIGQANRTAVMTFAELKAVISP